MENKIAGETDDELFELDWEMRKKTQTRRCSVFSKSFDPNSSKSSKTEVTDYAENSYEIVKNKPFIFLPCNSLNLSDNLKICNNSIKCFEDKCPGIVYT